MKNSKLISKCLVSQDFRIYYKMTWRSALQVLDKPELRCGCWLETKVKQRTILASHVGLLTLQLTKYSKLKVSTERFWKKSWTQSCRKFQSSRRTYKLLLPQPRTAITKSEVATSSLLSKQSQRLLLPKPIFRINHRKTTKKFKRPPSGQQTTKSWPRTKQRCNTPCSWTAPLFQPFSATKNWRNWFLKYSQQLLQLWSTDALQAAKHR